MTHKITLNQDADNEINIRIFSEKADGHVHLNIGDNIVCFEFSAEINPFYDHNDDVIYQGTPSIISTKPHNHPQPLKFLIIICS